MSLLTEEKREYFKKMLNILSNKLSVSYIDDKAAFDIDISRIEYLGLKANGKYLTPKEVLDMFFETGILVSKSPITVIPVSIEKIHRFMLEEFDKIEPYQEK